MFKLTLTAGLCLIIASLAVPGFARNRQVYKTSHGNPCYGRPDGLYPNPNDQHSYYNCVWGRTYIQRCPEDLLYRHSITACYYPGSPVTGSSSHENCDPMTTTSDPTTTIATTKTPHTTTTTMPTTTTNAHPTTSFAGLCNGNAGRFFPHPDPTRFIQCGIQGRVFIQLCPAGLTFNAASNTCT